MPDSYHRTVSWITKGIEGEIIGDSAWPTTEQPAWRLTDVT